jgi:phosphopantothenoylcysteine synthetase/decarboxylase
MRARITVTVLGAPATLRVVAGAAVGIARTTSTATATAIATVHPPASS